MKKNHIAIGTTVPERQSEAEALAKELNLDCLPDPGSEASCHYDYLLRLAPDYLGIQKMGGKKPSLFYIDFLSAKMRYRRQQAGLRKELVARAMGAAPGPDLTVIDATAGLGRDSFMLASLGFKVTMLERSAILYALLQDGLMRASRDADTARICARLTLVHADAISWLALCSGPHRPDIIYLDPMFPERKKSASVKKEMAFLQQLLPKDEDAEQLFEIALTCASRRVVVKRPRIAGPLMEKAPSFSLLGKCSRFDVYLR